MPQSKNLARVHMLVRPPKKTASEAPPNARVKKSRASVLADADRTFCHLELAIGDALTGLDANIVDFNDLGEE